MQTRIEHTDFGDLPPGSVRCVYCGNAEDAVHDLLLDTKAKDSTRILYCPLPVASGLEGFLRAGLSQLSELAGVLWPHWYGEVLLVRGNGQLKGSLHALAVHHPQINLPWLRHTARACISGTPLLTGAFPRAVHAAQLSLALGPSNLLLVLACDASEIESSPLFCLARASEWFAQYTGSRILLVLRDSHVGRHELDAVAYKSLDLSIPPSAHRPDQGQESGWVWPILGRPHPQSPGEQALAAALSADPELGKLFEFNVRIETARGSCFLVDLLWRAGHLVIEVDGYRFHSAWKVFRSDRERDYELVISGYTVIRLTHDEIMSDTQTAIEKVRDVVRFLIDHPRQLLEN